jgi:hypothetical protein
MWRGRIVGLERQPGEQQERSSRSGCRVIAQVAKATAVLARDVALEPALLPGKGRSEGGSLGWHQRKHDLAEKIMHFFERVSGGDRV